MFGHDGLLEVAEKLDVWTRESINNTFAVTLYKTGLEESSQSHINVNRNMHNTVVSKHSQVDY